MDTDISYNIEKVLGYNCPNKYLLKLNGQNCCVVNSKSRAELILNYALTLDEALLRNGKIKRRVKEILKGDRF